MDNEMIGNSEEGRPGTFDGLAEAIHGADELRRRSERDHERELRARAGLEVTAKVLCDRAIEELSLREPWPTPPDFDRLMCYLDRCTETSRVCEGIGRELAWCQGFLGEDTTDFDALGAEATSVCARYRKQMLDYARKLLAEGEALDEAAVPAPSIRLEAASQADRTLLGELLAEVRTAYEKFRSVIADNGPFSLHPTTSPDTDARVAEEVRRMREANAKPYLGPLDDDFMCHVDAFWEGFRKLGQKCEEVATPNLTPVRSYFSLMADRLADALEGKRLGSVDVASLVGAIPREQE